MTFQLAMTMRRRQEALERWCGIIFRSEGVRQWNLGAAVEKYGADGSRNQRRC